jgi:hypothetical protein
MHALEDRIVLAYRNVRIDTTEIKSGIINSIKAIEQKVKGALTAAQKKLDQEETNAVAKIDSAMDCNKCHIRCNGKQYLELAAEVLGTQHALVKAQSAQTIENEENAPALIQLADAVGEAMKAKEAVFLQMEAELEQSKQSEESSCHWADIDCAKARLEMYAAMDEEFMMNSKVGQQERWIRSIGRHFHRHVVRHVAPVIRHVAPVVKNVAQKAGSAVKNEAQKAGGAVKNVAQKAGSAAFFVAGKVKEVGEKAKNFAADKACQASFQLCMKSCGGVKSAAGSAAKVAFTAAKKTVESVFKVFTDVTRIITSVLSTVALDMSIETKLDKEEFNLAAAFYLKAGSFEVRFSYKFNFKLAKLVDIVVLVCVVKGRMNEKKQTK